MQMALCSFLSLTGPSPWPQAVIKAVISSYSLKERAGPWEGFRESWRGREGGREGGRKGDGLKKEEWGLFLPEEVPSIESPRLKNGSSCNVCIIVVFPQVCLRKREEKNLWSKSNIIASFMIHQIPF